VGEEKGGNSRKAGGGGFERERVPDPVALGRTTLKKAQGQVLLQKTGDKAGSRGRQEMVKRENFLDGKGSRNLLVDRRRDNTGD